MSRPVAAPVSSVGHRFAVAAVYSAIGGIVARVLQGITPVLFARHLGPAQFGVYGLVMSVITVLTTLSNAGQNNALQKLLPEYIARDRRRGAMILGTTTVIIGCMIILFGVMLFLGSGFVATVVYKDASLSSVFRISAVLLVFLALFNFAGSACMGLQLFREYTIGLILRSGGLFIIGWVGMLLLGVRGALIGHMAAAGMALVYLGVQGNKAARSVFGGNVSLKVEKSVLGEIVGLSLPSTLASLVLVPATWWGTTVLERRSGVEQLGLFSAAFAVAQLILLLPAGFSTPAVSFLSESHTIEGRERFNWLAGRSLVLVWAVSLPVTIGTIVGARSAVLQVFGSRFESAVPLIQFMSITALVMAVGNQIGNVIASLGKMWQAFVINALWAAMFICLVALRVPVAGARGLAEAYGISYVLFAVILWVYCKQFLAVDFAGIRGIVSLTAVSLVVSLFICRVVVTQWRLLLACIALTVLTGILEWYVVLTTEERKNIAARIRAYLRRT